MRCGIGPRNFTPSSGRAPSKPKRGLIRTDDAGIIELRGLFRERSALRFLDVGKQDRPAGVHGRALTRRTEGPGHYIRKLAIDRSAEYSQHHVMAHFVLLECGHMQATKFREG